MGLNSFINREITRKFQIIGWKFYNSGKIQNNAINNAKQISSNGLWISKFTTILLEKKYI